tara:strand:- start:1886 stop:2395 length:510 start_codon:yes stop_codon:yes gene_type:complete
MSSILKVSEIQDPTNGNTALSIDSSGRVLKPNQICFSAYHSANIAHGSAVNVDIVYNTTRFKVGNDYSTSTGIFTVPTGCAGKYLVNCSGMFMDETSFTFIFLAVRVNDVTKQEFMASGRNNYSTVNGSMLLDLSVGDEVNIYSGTNGVDAGYWRGGDNFNLFDMYYLG